jgi:hypothetical protein
MTSAVRPISPDDAESVRKALDSVARERRYILMVEAPPLHEVRRFITECILSDEPYYVAVDSKDIVGFCLIARRREAGFGHVGRRPTCNRFYSKWSKSEPRGDTRPCFYPTMRQIDLFVLPN